MKICFVIPAYNDEVSLKKLIENIKLELKKFTLHFIVVNDCSNDKFESLKNSSQIDLITLIKNCGSQKAISIGLNYILDKEIDFDYLIVMDSDGEDKPEDLNSLINKTVNNGDNFITFASRKKRQETLMFKFFYFFYRFAFKVFTGKGINFGNFSCIPKKLLKNIVNAPHIDFHYSAAIIKSKQLYRTVPCNKGKRYMGQSKMSFGNLFFHALKSLSIFYEKIFIRFLIIFFIANFIILLNFNFSLAIVLNLMILTPVLVFLTYLYTLIKKKTKNENLVNSLNYSKLIKDIRSL